MKIKITSSAFKNGGMIPRKYGYQEENISPPLAWSNVPGGTKSIALIIDDPDAPLGDWVHWVIFNVPAEVNSLPEKMPRNEILDNGARQGVNDFKSIGYDGPTPPRGIHRYYFKIYAVDKELDLDPGATKRELLNAMEGHILGEGLLVGRYKR